MERALPAAAGLWRGPRFRGPPAALCARLPLPCPPPPTDLRVSQERTECGPLCLLFGGGMTPVGVAHGGSRSCRGRKLALLRREAGAVFGERGGAPLGAGLPWDVGRAWLLVTPSRQACFWNPPAAWVPAWVAALHRPAAGGCWERLRVCGGDRGLRPGGWKARDLQGLSSGGAGAEHPAGPRRGVGRVRRKSWVSSADTRGSPVQRCLRAAEAPSPGGREAGSHPRWRQAGRCPAGTAGGAGDPGVRACAPEARWGPDPLSPSATRQTPACLTRAGSCPGNLGSGTCCWGGGPPAPVLVGAPTRLPGRPGPAPRCHQLRLHL